MVIRMPHTPLPMDIVFLVKLVHDAIDRRINQELEDQHLTNSQMSVLSYLCRRGEADTTIRDIQDFLNVSHPTAAGLVRRLEQKGFVHLTTDPRDRRARIVRPDASVIQNARLEPKPTLHMEERLLQGLSDEECRQLCSLLMCVYENIK